MVTAREIKAGAAYIELSTRSSKLVRGLDKAEAKFKKFGANLQSIGRQLAAVGGLATGAFLGAVAVFAKTGDQLDKLSKRTGVSVESLGELKFAAEQNGSSLAGLEKGFRSMVKNVRNLDRGLSTAVDSFDAIGISAKDLEGLSPEKQFELIADGISKVEDDSKRAAIALEIFGRSGQELLPLFDQGAAGLKQFKKEARELGIVMSTEDATAAAEFTDAMNRVESQTSFVVKQIGAALAPALTDFLNTLTPILRAVIDWVKENKGLVVTIASVAAGILAAGGAAVAFGVGVSIAGVFLGGLSAIISAVGTAIGVLGAALSFILSPMGLVIVAVGAVVAILGKMAIESEHGQQALQDLKTAFSSVLATAKETFGGIADAIKAGDVQLAMKVLKAGMFAIWSEITEFLKIKWIDFKEFFFNSVTAIQTFFSDAMLAAIDLVQKGFVNSSAAIAQVWDALVTTLQKAIVSMLPVVLDVFATIIDSVNEVISLFDEGLAKTLADTASGIRTLSPTIQKSLDDNFQNRSDEREQERQRRITEIDSSSGRNELRRAADDASRKRAEEFERQREKASEQTRKAKEEFAKVRAEAAKAREEAEAEQKKAQEDAQKSAANGTGDFEGAIGGFSGSSVSRNLGVVGLGDKVDRTNTLLGDIKENTSQPLAWS